jgi:hypothetical protein
MLMWSFFWHLYRFSKYTEEVLDLSGLVSRLGPYAVFDGTYSTIFMGQWKETKVCLFFGYFQLCSPNQYQVAIKVIRAVDSLATVRRVSS